MSDEYEDVPAPGGLDNFRRPEGGACLGWQRVCPDGKLRGAPYHNKGDAEFDTNYVNDPAEVPDHKCDNRWAEYPDGPPTCPGGVHTLEPVAFDHD